VQVTFILKQFFYKTTLILKRKDNFMILYFGTSFFLFL